MEIQVVAVKETIELVADRPGTNHPPGLVIVFDGRQCSFKLPVTDTIITLIRPDGTQLAARLTEVKSHGEGRSFFLPGLVKHDAPVGSIASWMTPAGIPAQTELEPVRV